MGNLSVNSGGPIRQVRSEIPGAEIEQSAVIATPHEGLDFLKKLPTEKPNQLHFEITIPDRVKNMEDLREGFGVLRQIVDEMMAIVPKSYFRDGRLETDHDLAIHSFVQEGAANAFLYGLVGLDSKGKEGLLIQDDNEDPRYLAAKEFLAVRLARPRSESEKVIVKIEFGEDAMRMSIQDPGKFPDFSTKWKMAKEGNRDEGSTYAGLGLMWLARYFDAEQDPKTGAITLTRKIAS